MIIVVVIWLILMVISGIARAVSNSKKKQAILDHQYRQVMAQQPPPPPKTPAPAACAGPLLVLQPAGPQLRPVQAPQGPGTAGAEGGHVMRTALGAGCASYIRPAFRARVSRSGL